MLLQRSESQWTVDANNGIAALVAGYFSEEASGDEASSTGLVINADLLSTGSIAREAAVRRVEPFHFSPRYGGPEARRL